MQIDKGFDIAQLIIAYLEGELSDEQRRSLEEWLKESPEHEGLLKKLQDQEFVSGELRIYESINLSENRAKIVALLPGFFKSNSNTPGDRKTAALAHRVQFLRTAWFRYAAVLILLFGAGAYLWFKYGIYQQQTPTEVSKRFPLDIPSGKDGAVLTLADGTTVILDSLANGVIAMQNGSRVLLQNGRLAYDPTGKADGGVAYNIIATPKGRQFQVLLPDGTKVWLNAASSLKYPTVFGGKERRIEVTGEAYFEVAQNNRLPFTVSINDRTEVEVLGTNFNVNAYTDEASVNTTLLQGAVRVNTSAAVLSSGPIQSETLKPGQQAQIILPGKIKVVNDANLEQVMAWKDGVFNFEDASLEKVMRQLERWYDIEVVYEKGIPPITFWGKMGRDLSLGSVLGILERAEVHFRIEEGRKLVVLP